VDHGFSPQQVRLWQGALVFVLHFASQSKEAKHVKNFMTQFHSMMNLSFGHQ